MYRLFIQISVIRFDHVGALLTHHVHGVLDAAVRNDGEHRRVDDPQFVHPVNLELGINDALLDVFGQAGLAPV